MNILITSFNRPEYLLILLDFISKENYNNLFISVDQAKSNDPINIKKSNAVKKIAIDFSKNNKNVHLIIYELNQGCRKAVSKSITRCFELVEDLIILEDDCMPEKGFFKFCEWGLNEFRFTSEVGSISSQSFLFGRYQPKHDIYYSKYHHCWGWATWKRSWVYYQDSVEDFESFFNSSELLNLSSGEIGFAKYWKRIYFDLCRGKFDSWAYRWLFSNWMNKALSVTPRYSLSRNIGFNIHATHTKNIPSGMSKNYSENWIPISFTKPHKIERDRKAEKIDSNHHYHCWIYSNKLIEILIFLLRQIKR